MRAEEANAAQKRFSVALEQVSIMQSSYLVSEDRRKELETGIEVIQKTLQRVVKERDKALQETSIVTAQLESKTGSARTDAGRADDIESTVDFLTAALDSTAQERDQIASDAAGAFMAVQDLEHEARLVEDRNNKIFAQLEEAVSVSLSPLDKMFRKAGMPTDRIIEQVRRGYSGQGGPLTPIAYSTKGNPMDLDSLRANAILGSLDKMNMYRIAAEKAPFAIPVKSAFRFTSGFGVRRDPITGGSRMHAGTDFAASSGTPIYATADGVVTHAGWSSGFGNLVKIQHAFGIETLYAHQSKIRVKVGQRVSRGDRIGDMGNTGRSTGTHLHYEVRVGGKPVNPMVYIKAANDVF
jgi:murein DD-endopeptidase MepM/ murein hydrolase activator NlpD